MTVKLTIVIPSYNRPEKLLVTLRALIPQLGGCAHILVLDNCSKVAYEQYCTEADEEIKRSAEQGHVRFIRHACNIGMSANFMRAFELCINSWLWLVSDDDLIAADSVSTIIGTIRALAADPHVAFIKFSSRGCKVDAPEYMHSLDDLIDVLSISMVHFNSYIFISNGVYWVPAFREYIERGYQYLNTYVPHLVMLLHYMDSHPRIPAIYLSEKHVASYLRPDVGYSYGFVAGLGVGAFKNFTFNLTKDQYRRLEAVFAAHNDFKVMIDLFYYAYNKSNMYVARRLVSNYYIQICDARNVLHRAALQGFMLLFFTPGLLRRVVEFLPVIAPSLKRHILEIESKYRG
jgi:glycosyltransferase involved in cell wall biosynthesis